MFLPTELQLHIHETVKGVLRINTGLTNRRAAEIKLWNSK